MFGLIAEERLYLKTDDTTRPDFESAGGEPFVYDAGKGRKPVTTYRLAVLQIPADVLHLLQVRARRPRPALDGTYSPV
jgi:DNA transformation protein and related proteins